MDNTKTVRIIGIFIIIIMAASMFAIGVLYNGNSSSSTAPVDTAPLAASKFNYSLTFDTVAIKDMGTIKLAAKTTATDKDAVDAAVLKVASAAKVLESSFMKDQSGGAGWYYIAKISLKKDADPKAVSDGVFALSYFSDGSGANDVRKYMTVATKPIVIHNTDLNVDRDYNFETTTLLAMTGLDTRASDNITVEGTMVLQGTAISSIDLFESANKSAQEKPYSFSGVMKISSVEKGAFFDGNRLMTTNIDEAKLKGGLKLIDADANIFLFSSGSSLKAALDKNSTSTLIDTIKQVSGVTKTEASADNLTLTIDFNKSLVAQVAQTVSKALVDSNYAAQLTYPTEFVYGQLSDASKSAAVSDYLSSEGITANFTLAAVIDANAIMVPDLGKELPLADKSFRAEIRPNHLAGDDVNLLIQVSVQRDLIASVQAKEQ